LTFTVYFTIAATAAAFLLLKYKLRTLRK